LIHISIPKWVVQIVNALRLANAAVHHHVKDAAIAQNAKVVKNKYGMYYVYWLTVLKQAR
jgi:hypothetical protein